MEARFHQFGRLQDAASFQEQGGFRGQPKRLREMRGAGKQLTCRAGALEIGFIAALACSLFFDSRCVAGSGYFQMSLKD